MANLKASKIVLGYAAGFDVVHGIGIEASPGTVVGILGPNGSGKSTIIRALSRIMRPKSGEVLLGARDLYGEVTLRESARQVAVVPQTEAATLDFTVRDIVLMGRQPHSKRRMFGGVGKEDVVAADSALQRTSTMDLADRPITQLSGGEAQRVLLARALAQETEILLLDEPTAHLDLLHQNQILDLVRDLAHTDGKTVVCVLHDLNQAAEYCDVVYLMREGKILAQGTPREALTSANILEAYGVEVQIDSQNAEGRLNIRAVSLRRSAELLGNCTVHLVCGGGTGSTLMRSLVADGCTVTAAALNRGDTDLETAEYLGLVCPAEDPFSPLSENAIVESLNLALAASVIVVTDVPFGPGNVAHLCTVQESQTHGVPVIVLMPPDSPMSGRDFTGGEAEALWNQIVAAGAATIGAIGDLRGLLTNLIGQDF